MKNKIVKIMSIAAIGCVGFQASGQNLLTINSGFESGKTGWYFDSKDGITEIVTDNVHSGKNALKISTIEGKGIKFFFTKPEEQPLSIKAEKKYQLKVWLKVTVPAKHIELRVYGLRGFKQDEDILISTNGAKLKTNEWQLITVNFIGKEYDKAKFSIGINKGEVIVDDFELVEIQ